jgi:hypothetical protein
MSVKHLLITITCFTLAYCGKIPAPNVRCDLKTENSGLSQRYWENIAHAIHSMNVQTLQTFNTKATEDNHIPTINMNVHSEPKVLSNAPSDPLPNDFYTPEMNLIDRILSRVGVITDGVGDNWTPVERIVHHFHMRDVWNKLKPVYDKLVVNSTVCACVLNVEESGVKSYLDFYAESYEKGTYVSQLPISHLENAENWKLWKQWLLNYYTDQSFYDAAYFLKCTAN